MELTSLSPSTGRSPHKSLECPGRTCPGPGCRVVGRGGPEVSKKTWTTVHCKWTCCEGAWTTA